MVVASLIIFFATWQILSYYLFSPYLIPPPTQVFATAVPMILSGEIFRDAGISLLQVMIGFSFGSAAAIVVGVIMGRLRIVNELLDPITEFLRYLSPTAMIPIAVIWFGIGEQSKYFLIFWGTFFFVLINTIAGVIRTPLARQRAAQCLGANELQIFLIVVIPSAIPYIITGMRVAMASSFMRSFPPKCSPRNPDSAIYCKSPGCSRRLIASSSRSLQSACSASQPTAYSATWPTGH